METIVLSKPRFVNVGEMTIAGLSQQYTREQMMEIPAQWDNFNASLYKSSLPYAETYGVIYPTTPMRYIAGIEIAPDLALPDGWESVNLPARHYVVFSETGGKEAIRLAWPEIYMTWLPKSGRKLVAGAAMIEKYPGDWVTSGDFEIWLALEAA